VERVASVPRGLLLGSATREDGTHFDVYIAENTGTGAIVELLFLVN
jgi:hypothetical protein